MDPISILGAVKTIADTVLAIKDFVKSVKEARGDLKDVVDQLKLLQRILSRLKAECESEAAADPAIQPMLGTVSATVRNCDSSVQNINAVLKKYQRGSLLEPAIWAVSGKQDVETLKKDLEARTIILQLSLNTVQFCLTRAIKSDVSTLVQDSAQIKQQLSAILTMIQNRQPDTPGAQEEIEIGIQSISDITGVEVQPGAFGGFGDEGNIEYSDESDDADVFGDHDSMIIEPVPSPSPTSSLPTLPSGAETGMPNLGDTPAELKLLRSFDSIEKCSVGRNSMAIITPEGQVSILELPNLTKVVELSLDGREPRYVTFSSNFQCVLVICKNNTLTVWRTSDGSYEGEVPGHRPASSRDRVAMSRDKQFIATTARKGTMEIWEKKDSCFSRILSVEIEGRLEKFGFSSGGDLLGVFRSDLKTGFLMNKRFYSIDIWSTSQLRRLRTIQLGQSQVTGQQSVKFLIDEENFSAVTMSDATQELSVWDLNTGVKVDTIKAWQSYKLRALPKSMPKFNVSADQRLVVLDRLTRNDKRQRVDLWDLENKRLVGKIATTTGQVRLCGSSLDGKVKILCTWRNNVTLDVWEVAM